MFTRIKEAFESNKSDEFHRLIKECQDNDIALSLKEIYDTFKDDGITINNKNDVSFWMQIANLRVFKDHDGIIVTQPLYSIIPIKYPFIYPGLLDTKQKSEIFDSSTGEKAVIPVEIYLLDSNLALAYSFALQQGYVMPDYNPYESVRFLSIASRIKTIDDSEKKNGDDDGDTKDQSLIPLSKSIELYEGARELFKYANFQAIIDLYTVYSPKLKKYKDGHYGTSEEYELNLKNIGILISNKDFRGLVEALESENEAAALSHIKELATNPLDLQLPQKREYEGAPENYNPIFSLLNLGPVLKSNPVFAHKIITAIINAGGYADGHCMTEKNGDFTVMPIIAYASDHNLTDILDLLITQFDHFGSRKPLTVQVGAEPLTMGTNNAKASLVVESAIPKNYDKIIEANRCYTILLHLMSTNPKSAQAYIKAKRVDLLDEASIDMSELRPKTHLEVAIETGFLTFMEGLEIATKDRPVHSMPSRIEKIIPSIRTKDEIEILINKYSAMLDITIPQPDRNGRDPILIYFIKKEEWAIVDSLVKSGKINLFTHSRDKDYKPTESCIDMLIESGKYTEDKILKIAAKNKRITLDFKMYLMHAPERGIALLEHMISDETTEVKVLKPGELQAENIEEDHIADADELAAKMMHDVKRVMVKDGESEVPFIAYLIKHGHNSLLKKAMKLGQLDANEYIWQPTSYTCLFLYAIEEMQWDFVNHLLENSKINQDAHKTVDGPNNTSSQISLSTIVGRSGNVELAKKIIATQGIALLDIGDVVQHSSEMAIELLKLNCEIGIVKTPHKLYDSEELLVSYAIRNKLWELLDLLLDKCDYSFSMQHRAHPAPAQLLFETLGSNDAYEKFLNAHPKVEDAIKRAYDNNIYGYFEHSFSNYFDDKDPVVKDALEKGETELLEIHLNNLSKDEKQNFLTKYGPIFQYILKTSAEVATIFVNHGIDGINTPVQVDRFDRSGKHPAIYALDNDKWVLLEAILNRPELSLDGNTIKDLARALFDKLGEEGFFEFMKDHSNLAQAIILDIAHHGMNAREKIKYLLLGPDGKGDTAFPINAEGANGNTVGSDFGNDIDMLEWLFTHGYILRHNDIIDTENVTYVSHPKVVRSTNVFIQTLLEKQKDAEINVVALSNSIIPSLQKAATICTTTLKSFYKFSRAQKADLNFVDKNDHTIINEILRIAEKAMRDVYLNYREYYPTYRYFYKKASGTSDEDREEPHVTLVELLARIKAFIDSTSEVRLEEAKELVVTLLENTHKDTALALLKDKLGLHPTLDNLENRAKIYEFLNQEDNLLRVNNLCELNNLFTELSGMSLLEACKVNYMFEFGMQIYISYTTYGPDLELAYGSAGSACGPGTCVQATKTLYKLHPDFVNAATKATADERDAERIITTENIKDLPAAIAEELINTLFKNGVPDPLLEDFLSASEPKTITAEQQSFYVTLNNLIYDRIKILLPLLDRPPTAEEYQMIIGKIRIDHKLQTAIQEYNANQPNVVPDAIKAKMAPKIAKEKAQIINKLATMLVDDVIGQALHTIKFFKDLEDTIMKSEDGDILIGLFMPIDI